MSCQPLEIWPFRDATKNDIMFKKAGSGTKLLGFEFQFCQFVISGILEILALFASIYLSANGDSNSFDCYVIKCKIH